MEQNKHSHVSFEVAVTLICELRYPESVDDIHMTRKSKSPTWLWKVMPHYLSFNLPTKTMTYCDDICNYMAVHGLFLVLYVIRVEKSICNKYMQALLI